MLVLVASACGAPADSTLDLTFDPCSEIVIAPPAELAEADRTAIAHAFALWNEVYQTGLTLGAPGAPGDLPLRFEDAAPVFLGLYDDEHGQIFINSNLTGRALEITVAHELGHAFGSLHIDSRPSVMNPANTTTEPLGSDAAELVDRWGYCP